MSEKKSFQDQINEAADKIKEVSGNTYEAFKQSDAGKQVFGEDGKFGDDDKQRIGEEANKIKDQAVDAAKKLFKKD